jgi:hypothetical protein
MNAVGPPRHAMTIRDVSVVECKKRVAGCPETLVDMRRRRIINAASAPRELRD